MRTPGTPTLTAILTAFTLAACGSADAAVVAGPSQAGSGGDRGGCGSVEHCPGPLTGTFENITVPAGATCTVRDAVVKGNIKALENARLYVIDRRVGGNIQGDEAAIVQVSGGTVDGDIQIVENTVGDALEVVDNRVARNLQVFENGGAGRKTVRANTVRLDLQCEENGGRFTGGPNSAGDVEGQCF